MNFLSQLIISALAVVVTSLLLPGVHIDSVWTAILVAAVLAFLNTIVKPILVILTIPITILTLGIFLLVINATLILLTSKLVHGFAIDGFWTALFFSIILSFVNSVFTKLSTKDGQEQ